MAQGIRASAFVKLHELVENFTVQGEIVVTPGREAVGKPHPRRVKPIEDRGNKLQRYVMPEKNCTSERIAAVREA